MVTRESDVVIIGGGPAGLCAALTASSEGLKTVLMDSKPGLGGQAKDSSLIENYPGFPDGISGAELAANFVRQAIRFGVDLLCPLKATHIAQDGDRRIVATDEGDLYVAKAVVLASGLSYKRLMAKNVPLYLGRGIFYGAPANLDREKKNYCVVGGANSAGQAAVHLATYNPEGHVRMLIRGQSLSSTMSQYLIEKIEKLPNIEQLFETEVEEALGGVQLEGLVLRSNGSQQQVETDGLYIFIGASPKTFWLKDLLALDDRGYILSGPEVRNTRGLMRELLFYETSMPGVFAAGDVRSSFTKRVVAAAGEGSMAIQNIHRYLPMLNHK